MKLLFDANLSFHLANSLGDLYPNSVHVRTISLKTSSDKSIWDYARINGYTIVTKDADFNEYTILHGFPPKVIWLRIGNCSTNQIEVLLREKFDEIKQFQQNPETSSLILI